MPPDASTRPSAPLPTAARNASSPVHRVGAKPPAYDAPRRVAASARDSQKLTDSFFSLVRTATPPRGRRTAAVAPRWRRGTAAEPWEAKAPGSGPAGGSPRLAAARSDRNSRTIWAGATAPPRVADDPRRDSIGATAPLTPASRARGLDRPACVLRSSARERVNSTPQVTETWSRPSSPSQRTASPETRSRSR